VKFSPAQSTLAAAALAAGVLLALGAPLAASAHVSAVPSSTAAGSTSVVTFATSHGCEGSPTTSMAFTIPEGIASVSPTITPGWDVSKVAVDLETPIDDGHGNEITTRTGQVVYTAQAPLEDGFRTTFALSVSLPADAAGESIEFPVLQTCEVGANDWSDSTVEGEEEPASPAPFITVTEATGDEHGAASAVDTHAAADTTEASSDDVLARVLGVGGLAVGAVGIVLAVTARRKQAA